jgi:hypothetical protein
MQIGLIIYVMYEWEWEWVRRVYLTEEKVDGTGWGYIILL